MAGFRATLDAWLAGRADAEAVEQSLAQDLVADPQLAMSSRALIDAYQRAGHISLPLTTRLAAVIANPGAFLAPPPLPLAPPIPASRDPVAESPSERTVFRPRQKTSGNAPGMTPAAVAPANGPDPPSDRTVLRVSPRSTAPVPELNKQSLNEAPVDRTILRALRPAPETPVPPVVSAPPATADEVPEAKTQFRAVSPPPKPLDLPRDVTSAGASRTDLNPQTGSTHGTAGLSWNPTAGFSGSIAAPLQIGDVLNGRYVLEGIVPGGDKGGMGVVFKARDRINEEAEDRNPFVAIKVLNEEFKRHPDSMRALFNEVKNATKLAHPNIITVFNFNRDGGNVYMVMELLEGQPVDEVLRGVKDVGLPLAEALQIIQFLSRALAYAHQRNVVHADFKPSNAFITKEGFVKVLDFGIARAAGQVYDPGTLGAFTPLTASPEQIEGKNPETSDDVYALGVVSYQLLTGRHPFHRKNPETGKSETLDAVKAREAGLRPARVTRLSRSQWRTLQSAVAFTRGQRPPNAQAFADGMAPKRLPVALIASLGVAVLLLVIAGALLLPDLVANRRARGMLNELNSSSSVVVDQALQRLQGYEPSMRKRVLDLEGGTTAVIKAYEEEVRSAFDLAAGRYNVAGARLTLERAKVLLPDSQRISDLSASVDSAANRLLSEQAEKFDILLKSRKLLPDGGEPSLLSVLAVIKQLAPPNYPLLTDPRVPQAFRDSANQALNANDLINAARYVTEGTKLAPDDPNLRDARDRLDRARREATLAGQVNQLEKAVQPLAEPSATLADFRQKRSELTQLNTAKAADPFLVRAIRRLEALVGNEIPEILKAGNDQAAIAAVNEFQGLLSSEFLAGQLKVVEKVMGAAQARVAQADQLRTKIKALLAAPSSSDEWAKDLQAQLQQLRAIAPADAQITVGQQQASGYLLAQERELVKSNQFSEAERLLSLAHAFGAAEAALNDEENAIKRGRANLVAINQQSQLKAEQDFAKQRVLDNARAGGGRLDEALRQYNELVSKLSAADEWGSKDAPAALANGYLRSAQKFLLAGEFAAALKQAQVLRLLPSQAAQHVADLELYQGYATLADTLKSGSLDSAQPFLADLKRRDAATYERVEPRLVELISQRITTTTLSNRAQAETLIAAAQKAFPAAQFKPLPNASTPPIPPPVPVLPVLNLLEPSSAAPGVLTVTFSGSNLAGANGLISANTGVTGSIVSASASSVTATITVSPSAKSGLTSLSLLVKDQSVSQPFMVLAAPVPARTESAPIVATTPPPAARPCTKQIANAGGSGRSKGRCTDEVGGAEGPELVVVSAGNLLFAIMRDEVTYGDWTQYCAATGCAKPVVSAKNPVTSVSVAQAEQYATWLSGQSGARYRLPANAEWIAAVGTSVDKNSVNCAFASRGTALREVGLGAANEFGLRDVLGNVREWVRLSASSLVARGGAFGDPLDSCMSNPSEPHSGQPDGRTGFRLVREIN